MTIPGSYNASTHHKDLDSEVQRLRSQVLLSWEEEARRLVGFGLRNGMSVLEVGSGPGFYTEQLLTLLPSSPVTAVEIDPVLVERARQYLQDKSGDQLQIVEATVMNTTLNSNSFDFVVARFVFQHLPDPIGAATEIFRVLKPGGKLVIISSDRRMQALTEPPIPELELLEKKIAQFQGSRGGNSYSGGQLWRTLQTTGFVNIEIEAVTCHSGKKGIQAFLPQFSPEQGGQMVKLGVLSEQEANSLIAAREKFLASPNPFVLMVVLMTCGEKP